MRYTCIGRRAAVWALVLLGWFTRGPYTTRNPKPDTLTPQRQARENTWAEGGEGACGPGNRNPESETLSLNPHSEQVRILRQRGARGHSCAFADFASVEQATDARVALSKQVQGFGLWVHGVGCTV